MFLLSFVWSVAGVEALVDSVTEELGQTFGTSRVANHVHATRQFAKDFGPKDNLHSFYVHIILYIHTRPNHEEYRVLLQVSNGRR
jgi:hypothetical protein